MGYAARNNRVTGWFGSLVRGAVLNWVRTRGFAAYDPGMAINRVVLIHGAATTPSVWDRLIPLLAADDLPDLKVVAPRRPSSGSLEIELEALADLAHGSVLVGASGGATIGLAFLASDVRLAGAVLHEPAVGTLVPGLLDHVVAAHTADGVAGFGRALYGPGWTAQLAPHDAGEVARDLAMFRQFEPAEVSPDQGAALTTVGGSSPPPRHRAARELCTRFGIPTRVLPGSGHFVQRDNPAALAEIVLDVVRELRTAG